MPELQDNREFLESISLQYKSYNLFEEMMEIALMRERTSFIQEMKDSLVDMTPDGNDVKFFSSKFLVQKYLKLSDADLKLNEKLKNEEEEEFNLSGGEDAESELDTETTSNNPSESLNNTLATINEMDKESIKTLLMMLMEKLNKEDNECETDKCKSKPKKSSSKKKKKKSEEE